MSQRKTDLLYLCLCIRLLAASVPRSHYWLQSLLLPPDVLTLASSNSRASKHGGAVLLSLGDTRAFLCLYVLQHSSMEAIEMDCDVSKVQTKQHLGIVGSLCGGNECPTHITLPRFSSLFPGHEEMSSVSQHKLLVNLTLFFKSCPINCEANFKRTFKISQKRKTQVRSVSIDCFGANKLGCKVQFD